MIYTDYLNTDHWRDVKKHHYKLARRRHCYLCGSTSNLNVHHMLYKNKYGESFLNNENSGMLRTLCKDCHQLFHKYLPLGGGTRNYYRLINLMEVNVPRETAFIAVADGKRSYRREFRKYKKLYGSNRI